jgi:hypothetical protein
VDVTIPHGKPGLGDKENEPYEQEVIKAWRKIPFRPSPPEKAEIGIAAVIRDQLRVFGFDLRLGSDGSVLIVDTKGKHRAPPVNIAEGVWERVEAIGALLDQEKEQER